MQNLMSQQTEQSHGWIHIQNLMAQQSARIDKGKDNEILTVCFVHPRTKIGRLGFVKYIGPMNELKRTNPAGKNRHTVKVPDDLPNGTTPTAVWTLNEAPTVDEIGIETMLLGIPNRSLRNRATKQKAPMPPNTNTEWHLLLIGEESPRILSLSLAGPYRLPMEALASLHHREMRRLMASRRKLIEILYCMEHIAFPQLPNLPRTRSFLPY
ncbi:hypothetical protein BDP27DRAFT_665251 [Rhodocollybia butyracea]|uniref:Uncharacterized protein n=1 Tax=Rhodocollybia butyracea TaxID=206335 RepID=A0A9P5PPU3_9AGAR|nr:hypothetical protein BDP27DRAFT_665251 [Rhodocollybia butyracea]